MSNETFTLNVETRERLGTRHSRRLRAAGKLPGIVYGHGHKPVPIAMEAKETQRHLNEGEKVFQLAASGDINGQTVLLKDIQFDYMGTEIVHVDFALVDLNETVEVSLPVNFRGDSVGLKQAGAMLLHPTSEVRVKCRVGDMVDSVELDITNLDVGDAAHASALELPSGFELISDPEDVIALIRIAKVEEEETAEEGEAEGEGAEPEVVGEKKEEGEASAE